MQNSNPCPDAIGQRYLRPGRVVAVEGDSLQVAFGPRHTPATTRAVLAMPQPTVLALGDRVLVTEGDDGVAYIIGCVSPPAPPQQAPPQQVVRAAGSGRVRVEDAQGRLLFDYDAKNQKTTVVLPEGDLELRTQKGSIRLAAEMTTLDLAPDGLSMRAAKADIDIDVTTFRGRTIHGVLQSAKWIYERLETVASRLFERTKNTYRRSDELHQTTAGRMRTLVDGSYRVRSGQTDLRSDGDVRIDGKHIHLG